MGLLCARDIGSISDYKLKLLHHSQLPGGYEEVLVLLFLCVVQLKQRQAAPTSF